MKKSIIWCCLFFIPLITRAQNGYTCATPIAIPDLTYAYCSGVGQYNNTNVTQAGVTWFKFTAIYTTLTVTASGANIGGTLQAPTIKVYSDCTTEIPGALISNNANITTLHLGQLTTGNTYYLAISGQTLGSFKLCVNNYNVAPSDGEDCATAMYLENTNDFHISGFLGVGLLPQETLGTCLDGHETNTTWYKWKAANDGKLVFTITPDHTDNDIDFVLYDLGTTGDCINVIGANAVRCAAGHGINCNPAYYKTGLSYNAADEQEGSGCPVNTDGVVKYVDQIPGHTYGLIISNFSGNQGFSLSFKDLAGQPSTAKFELPDAVIKSNLASCTARSYVFNSYSTQNNIFKWDFGQGATISDADAAGNFTVAFDSGGTKTIKLLIYNTLGQSHTTTTTIDVLDMVTPAKPTLAAAPKAVYCPGDVIKLSANQLPGLTYQWTGPGTFMATSPDISIPVTDVYVPGTYYLTASNGTCQSEALIINPIVGINPQAAFTSSPNYPATVILPTVVNFNNQSVNAGSYLWNFGDGTTSTDVNPQHNYTTGGTYHVTLTAINSTTCSTSVTEGDYVIKYGNIIFIPNTFTPNSDGINDKFGVSITNLKAYHIQVFNRNGQAVFESRSANDLWDGQYKGSTLPVGTYYYIINATGLDNNEIKQSGWVSLIR